MTTNSLQDFLDSRLFEEAFATAEASFKRLRFVEAYLNHRKHETPLTWQQVFERSGTHLTPDAFFSVWVNVVKQREFKYPFLDALDISVETLQQVIALDHQKFIEAKRQPQAISSFQFRAMSTVYPIVKVNQELTIEEALDEIANFAKAKAAECVAHTEVSLYSFSKSGQVTSCYFEPELVLRKHTVLIKG